MTLHASRWQTLWNERLRAVRDVLGDTLPPGYVHPYSWPHLRCPGACALAFGPHLHRLHYTYMTLGVSQPGTNTPREFAIKTVAAEHWPVQVLYDLLTYLLAETPTIQRGLCLPLSFFRDPQRQLCAGLIENGRVAAEGSIRGVYLWEDSEQLRFVAPDITIELLVAIAVTEDEIELARDTSPPHLLLFLERMRIGQISDPRRRSVTQVPGADAEWAHIRSMSHNDVLHELQRSLRH